MARLYKNHDDRPLKSGRSFRLKKLAYRLVVIAVLLLGSIAFWPVGDAQKYQEQPVSVARFAVQRTAAILPLVDREAVGAPVAQNDADAAMPEKTPWAEQMRALQELAAISPDEAIIRISSIEDKHERKYAAASVCTIIAIADPAKAMTAAWALELGRFSDEAKETAALDAVARRWAEVDPIPALTWVSALPLDEESRRDYVVRGIASVLARESPDIAADLVAKHTVADGSFQIDAVLEVVQYWASRDQAAARNWVERLSEGALRTRCMEQFMRQPHGQSYQ